MKDEARIGERISALVELDEVVWNSEGDIYLDGLNEMFNKPLDFPRLLYVKLKTALPGADVEVWHNHFKESVTIVINGEEAEIAIPRIESRHLLIPMTDQLVEDIVE